MTIQGRRSKGCWTCRKRKVKCGWCPPGSYPKLPCSNIIFIDEEHPHCSRCKRAGLQCKGYHVDLKYIDEGTRLRQPRFPAETGLEPEQPSARISTLRPFSQQEPTPTLRLQKPFDLSGFKETIFRSFLVERLLGGHRRPDAPGWWLNETSNRTNGSGTYAISINALGAAFYGRVHHQESIVVEAARTYGRALRGLKEDLGNPIAAWSYETLAAAMALGMYEVCLYFVTILVYPIKADRSLASGFV